MLKPLPFPQGERFVAIYGARIDEPGRYSSSSFPDLIEYQARTTSFDVFGWFRLANFNLTAPGEPQYLAGAEVTPSLARSLGVPSLGQWFVDEQGAVISNTLWMRLGSDPNIVGKPLTLDDRQFTITGVMPREFEFPVFGTTTGRLPFEIWIALDPTGKGQRPDQGVYFANARRKPGVSLQQAQADVARVAADIARADPVSHPMYTAVVMDLRRQTLTDLQSTLLLLFGAAGLLLLIACANVATLLLARSVARARETAIRVALGAGRAHLALRYLAEGAVVSLIGAAAGVGLSVVLVRLIVVAGSEYVPYADELSIDWKVLAFAIAMAFVASALASLAPLWQAVRTPPNAVLTEGVRASAGGPVRKISQALVVAEIALAFTLLTVSVILVVHLRNLGRVPTGFDPNNLLTFQLSAPGRVAGSGSLVPFQKRLIEALEAIPGVTSAAVVNQLPLDGCCMGGTVHVEGRPPGDEGRRVSFLFVTPGFLPAMGIPLRAGRFLTEADTSEDVLFAVVNQAAVNRYWPDRNPVGATGRLNRPDGNRFQVVGVIGDVRNDGLNKVPEAELYLLGRADPGQSHVSGGALVAPVRSNSSRRSTCRAERRSDTRHSRRAADDGHRPGLAAARTCQLARDDLLRAGSTAHGDARHLRRRLVWSSPADGRTGHAHGAGRGGPRSDEDGGWRWPQDGSERHGRRSGGADRQRRVARSSPRHSRCDLGAVCAFDRRRCVHLRCGVVCAGVACEPPVADGRHSRRVVLSMAVGAPTFPARDRRRQGSGRRSGRLRRPRRRC